MPGRRRRRLAAISENSPVLQRIELPATPMLAPGKRDSDSRRAVSASNRSSLADLFDEVASSLRRYVAPSPARLARPPQSTRAHSSASKYRASAPAPAGRADIGALQTPANASSRVRNLPPNFPFGGRSGRLKVARSDSSTAAGYARRQYVSFTHKVLRSASIKLGQCSRYSSRMPGWAQLCHCPGQLAYWLN